MSGSPSSFIASGATIAPNAELAWLSGVVAPDGTAPNEESGAAVSILKERVIAMGATLADVAELRVYRVAAGSDGDELGAAWNEVYGAEWNNEETNNLGCDILQRASNDTYGSRIPGTDHVITQCRNPPWHPNWSVGCQAPPGQQPPPPAELGPPGVPAAGQR